MFATSGQVLTVKRCLPTLTESKSQCDKLRKDMKTAPTQTNNDSTTPTFPKTRTARFIKPSYSPALVFAPSRLGI